MRRLLYSQEMHVVKNRAYHSLVQCIAKQVWSLIIHIEMRGMYALSWWTTLNTITKVQRTSASILIIFQRWCQRSTRKSWSVSGCCWTAFVPVRNSFLDSWRQYDSIIIHCWKYSGKYRKIGPFSPHVYSAVMTHVYCTVTLIIFWVAMVELYYIIRARNYSSTCHFSIWFVILEHRI